MRRLIPALFLLAACAEPVAPEMCALTGYESFPLAVKHANPDSSTLARDTVPADPPCAVGSAWEDAGLVKGLCVCMD
jgi:hypothetical protein